MPLLLLKNKCLIYVLIFQGEGGTTTTTTISPIITSTATVGDFFIIINSLIIEGFIGIVVVTIVFL